MTCRTRNPLTLKLNKHINDFLKKWIFILFFIPFISKAQTANINGVITYYFNEYQGDKPDIGSKVYIAKADDSKSLLFYNSVDSFFVIHALTYLQKDKEVQWQKELKMVNKYKGKKKHQEEYEKYQKMADESKRDLDNYTKKLLTYRVESATMMGMSIAASMKLTQFKEAAYKTTTVDGVGNYSFKVEPGKYLLIIISNGRTSLSSFLESSGKIFMKKVEVKENDTENISYNFTL